MSFVEQLIFCKWENNSKWYCPLRDSGGTVIGDWLFCCQLLPLPRVHAPREITSGVAAVALTINRTTTANQVT